MVGAFLGALGPVSGWVRRHRGWTERPTGRRAVTAVGLLGAAGCAWAIHSVAGDNALLYHGGFALMAVATGAVIVAVAAQPRSSWPGCCRCPPLGYIGRISYGLYLYHWPIFLMLDNGHTGLLGWRLLVVRLAATMAVSVASYHLVETTGSPASVPPDLAGRVAASRRCRGRGGRFGGGHGGPPGARRHHDAVRPLVRPTWASSAPTGWHPARRSTRLVLGDSLALTLGIGLSDHSEAWGVHVENRAILGCDLDPGSTVNIEGNVGQAAQGCAEWRHTWTAAIDRSDPDVVAIELGRWEVSDRIVNGKWTRDRAKPWDDLLGHLLDQAITVASQRGAKVVLFTLPYIQQTTEQPNGQPWDINLPAPRTNQYNAALRQAVARHPGVASIIDLNRLLDPNGHYTSHRWRAGPER